MFNLPTLESALTGTIYASKLHFSPITDSTNTDALHAARTGAPHGSVYFADEQLAGRGRGDHAWHSAAGQGLYVSVLLRPPIAAARLPLLPMAAGLAAADAIHAITSLTVDLRWPNDLLIGPRKVGGILVEAKTESSAIAYAVVGIGINVHQRSFAADLSTPAPPASLLHLLSGFVLYLFAGLTIALIVITAGLVVLDHIDWSALTGPLVSLVLMVGFLYWTTTLLPGPVKRLGKAAGRQVMKSIRKDRHE